MKTWYVIPVTIFLLLAAGGAYYAFSGSKTDTDALEDPLTNIESSKEGDDVANTGPVTEVPGRTARVDSPTRVEVKTPQNTYPQGIEGHVVSSTGGNVKGAEVYLLHGVSPTNMLQQLVALSRAGRKLRARIAANCTTGDAGTFKLQAPVTEGAAGFELRIRAPQHIVHKHTLRILPNRWEKLGVIKLQRGRTLTGSVRDAITKAPIVGALVRATVAGFSIVVPTPGREDGIETTSNESGSYTLAGLPDGAIELSAFAKEYGTFREQNIVFETGTRTQTKNIELPKGYSISGWVTDADGNPISRSRVEATPMMGAVSTPGHAYTDKDGQFDLLGLAMGEYIVSARAVGFARNEVKPVKAGKREVHVALERQGKIKVRVLARSGRPVKSYRVEVKTYFPGKATTYGRSTVPPIEVRGAPNGERLIAGIDAGTYLLQVTAIRFAKTYSDHFTVPEGQVDPISVAVTMNQGGIISGVVTDEAGTPIPGVSVYTLDDAYQDNPIFEIFKGLAPPKVTETTTVTKKSGQFRIALLTPAKYQLRIDHPSFARTYKKNIDVREGQQADVGRIKLTTGGRVRGVVYVDGLPKPGAKVTISSSAVTNGQGVYETTFTGKKGKFEFGRMLPAGQYEVQATRTDYPNPLLAIADIQKSRRVITVRKGVQSVTIQLKSR